MTDKAMPPSQAVVEALLECAVAVEAEAAKLCALNPYHADDDSWGRDARQEAKGYEAAAEIIRIHALASLASADTRVELNSAGEHIASDPDVDVEAGDPRSLAPAPRDLEGVVERLRKSADERKNATASLEDKALYVVAQISREDAALMSEAAALIEEMRKALDDLTSGIDHYKMFDDDHIIYMSVGRLRRARSLSGDGG
jgi:hypothetical protein